MRIVVTWKDGNKKEWPDERRPGGSYGNQVRAEGNFIVVTDVWYNETWIPAEAVRTLETYSR